MRPYAGALGPGLLLRHDTPRPHVAEACWQLMMHCEGTNAIDWPVCSSDH